MISESKEHYASKESIEDDVDEKPEASINSDKSFFEALKVFKDPQFLSLSIAELAASIGFLIPLYYMQSKFSSSGFLSGFAFIESKIKWGPRGTDTFFCFSYSYSLCGVYWTVDREGSTHPRPH